MRIQKINIVDNRKGVGTQAQNFTAGKTTLFSDFDGTYIPAKYNHDSVCNYCPPVNKGEFKSYFDKIWELFGKLKGNEKESKFDFVITTGRNLAETNYFLDRLKQQDLWVPLPEKLITCNGQDEYYRNVANEEEYYRDPNRKAFIKENVNNKKREYYKSKGWDYQAIVAKVKELIKSNWINNDVMFKDHILDIPSCIKIQLGINDTNEVMSILNEIIENQSNEQGIRAILESKNKKQLKDKKEKELHDWYMGELAHILYVENSKKTKILENIPTTRSKREYGDGLSLQAALERLGMTKNDDFVAFSDDGELGVRISVNKNNKEKSENLLDRVKRAITNAEISRKLQKGSYGGKEFEIKPQLIDKLEDTRKLVREILENQTNDLVIVAGDGENDLKMLDIGEYRNQDSKEDIPIVAIYVDNRSEDERKERNSEINLFLSRSKYYNRAERLKFIHVDQQDPAKPNTLEDALKIAICNYAKYNDAFRKNLSPEMQKMVEEYDYSYFVGAQIEEKNDQQIIDNKIEAIIANWERILDKEGAIPEKNIIDTALDENSNIKISERTLVLTSLSIIIKNYNEMLDMYGKEKVNTIIKSKLDEEIRNLRETARKESITDIRKEKIKKLKKLNLLKKKVTKYIEGDINILPRTWKEMLKRLQEKRLKEVEQYRKQQQNIGNIKPEIEKEKKEGILRIIDSLKRNKQTEIIDNNSKPSLPSESPVEIPTGKKKMIAEIIEGLKKYIFSKTGIIIITGLLTAGSITCLVKCKNALFQEKKIKVENVFSNVEKNI